MVSADRTSAAPRRRIAVVSSSRADLSHLIWPLRAIHAEPSLELIVFACGAALSAEYGRSADRLRAEGFTTIDVGEPLGIDTATQFASVIGRLTSMFASAIDDQSPGVMMVVADRAEMLAPATAALTMRVPIVHIEGGECSEGAIDDAVRHALTKMSHVHFVSTELAVNRVRALGEEPWRIHRVGAASLDHLRHTSLPDPDLALAGLGFDAAAPLLIVSIHPTTLAPQPLADGLAVLRALQRLDRNECPQVLLTFPNADDGGRTLRESCYESARSLSVRGIQTSVVVQCEPETWFSVLLHEHARAIVGNSSSVIMEAPAAGLASIVVGERQAGRELAASIRAVPADVAMIANAIRMAMRLPRAAPWTIAQPYGDGYAGSRIAAVLRDLPGRHTLLRKRWLESESSCGR